jgi:hypothetical protein
MEKRPQKASIGVNCKNVKTMKRVHAESCISSYSFTLCLFSRNGGCVERLKCKRPLQCLAYSEILTPHPLNARRVCYPPPLVRREYSLAGWRGGGGQYFGRRLTQLCTLHMWVLCGWMYCNKSDCEEKMFKGLVAWCHSFCLFLIFYNIHTFIQSQYIHPSPFAEASPYPHRLWAQWGKLPCGAEPGIELGLALQQMFACMPAKGVDQERGYSLDRSIVCPR